MLSGTGGNIEVIIYFEDTKKYLEILNVSYTENTKLVRGLDYYSDTVFRIKNDISDNLLEINQMGVEVLGIKDSLTDIEILNLAKETLSKVDKKYHIDISHAGILEKLFDVVKLTKVNKEYIINSIENRAKSDLEQFLKKLEIRDNYIDSFIKLYQELFYIFILTS